MKKLLKLFFICGCLSVATSAYSSYYSTLTITNNASDTNVEITTDLLCGSAQYLTPSSYRYTSTLKENPITVTQTKKATWQNCLMAEKKFFGDTSDHSYIYVTLKDLRSGESAVYVFHIMSGKYTKAISFAGRNYTVSMTHEGIYKYYHSVFEPEVSKTISQIIVDG